MNARERRKQQLLLRIESHRLLLRYEMQAAKTRWSPVSLVREAGPLLLAAGPLLKLAAKLPWGTLAKYGLLVGVPTAAATTLLRRRGEVEKN